MAKSLETQTAVWSRRAKTIPAMLGATVAAFLLAPVLLPIAALVDVAARRTALPTPRAYLFGLQYLFNDSAEIVLAPVFWVLAGFGRRLDKPASIRRHERLQMWSIDILALRAEQLLQLTIEVDDESASLDQPGPTIVLSRHCNLFDASLPSLLYQNLGFSVRGIIMAEMLADPGFDLIFGRLGSIFIPRDDGLEARRQIADLANGLGPTTVAAIFPEGRLFTPARLIRAKAKLVEQNPERAAHLEPLTHTLPPRSGGLSALLAGSPAADVVIIRHTGLEMFRPFSLAAGRASGPTTVRVSAERFDRATIPDDEAGEAAWLDDRWLALDAWITGEHLREQSGSAQIVG